MISSIHFIELEVLSINWDSTFDTRMVSLIATRYELFLRWCAQFHRTATLCKERSFMETCDVTVSADLHDSLLTEHEYECMNLSRLFTSKRHRGSAL